MFPELGPVPEGTPWMGASVPPSARVDPCAPSDPPAPDWIASRLRTRSRYLGAITLRLPARYVAREMLHIPAEAERHGGILVGSWGDTTGAHPGQRQAGGSLAIWVGPEPGYPTVGADTAARQLAAAECASAAPVTGTRVVTFTLDMPDGRQEYVAAVWPIAPGRYLRLLGSSQSADDVALFRRALATIRTDPPAEH